MLKYSIISFYIKLCLILAIAISVHNVLIVIMIMTVSAVIALITSRIVSVGTILWESYTWYIQWIGSNTLYMVGNAHIKWYAIPKKLKSDREKSGSTRGPPQAKLCWCRANRRDIHDKPREMALIGEGRIEKSGNARQNHQETSNFREFRSHDYRKKSSDFLMLVHQDSLPFASFRLPVPHSNFGNSESQLNEFESGAA